MTRILAALLLAALAAAMACGRRGSDVVTIPALLEADTLLSPAVNRADSALAVLEAVDTAALATDGDRALYALLLTQALYKLTDDPIDTVPILRAVDYYATAARGGDRHVRALTYAGAAAESNGNPVAAMRLYKTAELTADTAKGGQTLLYDFAYVEMRIGYLLKQQINIEKRDVYVLKKALNLFERIGDHKYLTACTFELGTSYAATDFDSCVIYLDRALAMTKERRDTSFMYDCMVRLADAYANGLHQYDSALVLLDSAMLLCPDAGPAAPLCAALCHARRGDTHAARNLLSESKKFPYGTLDVMGWHMAMEAIAWSEGDSQAAESHAAIAQSMVDSLELRSRPISLVEQSHAVSNQSDKNDYARTFRLISTLGAVLIVLVLVAGAIVLVNIRRLRTGQRALAARLLDVEHSRHDSELALVEVSRLYENAKQELNRQNKSAEALQSHIVEVETAMMEQRDKIDELKSLELLLGIINSCIQIKGHPKGLRNILLLLDDKLLPINLPETFWGKLYDYVDKHYNGLLSHINSHYPTVTEKEKRLIGMATLDIPNNIIARCLDYSNTQSVRNIKSSLPKRRMGIDTNIDNLLRDWHRNKGKTAS